MDSRLLVLASVLLLGLTLNFPSHAQSGDGGTDFDEIDSKAESSLDAEINAQSNAAVETTPSKPTESLDTPKVDSVGDAPAVEEKKVEPKKSKREMKKKAPKGKRKAKEKMQKNGENKKKLEARPAGAQKKKAMKKATKKAMKKAAKKNQRKKR